MTAAWTGGWSQVDLRHLDRAAAVALSVADDASMPEVLYQGWYAAPQEPSEQLPAWSAPLDSVLRTAHVGARSWSGPWPVVGNGVAGVAVVQAAGSRRAAARGDYLTEGPGAGLAPRAGSRVLVTRRRGGYAYDGWWRTWSDDWRPADSPPELSRIYLAPSLHRLAHLVAAVTGVLAGCEHAWSLKVGADPATLARADGAVLYLPDEAIAETAPRIVSACRHLVRAATPPCTRPLAPGIAWAEDPGTGDSFGEVIARLVARAWRKRSAEQTLADAAGRVFRSAGLDPSAPHLRGPLAEALR
ncbi:hypothetical protein DDE18_08435 [Nocardioides gansuensis]|uniref:Uncharacterized protein n=1 Tax=Nocardioides gansuensis TaxID=2138300 RepID=A0A2T8FC88_9ACTN|nr:T3SS effector HopA1 family protein [Nocardioides gansuensis]PVG83313.1 hypothetical protein DDE18_08435 [Nocardioides gansuensis]